MDDWVDDIGDVGDLLTSKELTREQQLLRQNLHLHAEVTRLRRALEDARANHAGVLGYISTMAKEIKALERRLGLPENSHMPRLPGFRFHRKERDRWDREQQRTWDTLLKRPAPSGAGRKA